MCRFVLVVIFVSCVSFGVLAEVATSACSKDPELKQKKLELRKCFNETVERHIKPSILTTGDCKTATDFGIKIDTFVQSIKTKCNKSFTLDSKYLVKLIEFSLRNDSFKKFYEDISCVTKLEYNISNCVLAKVGFFNVTEEQKHTTWITKGNLKYDRSSCKANENVNKCVQAVLTACSPPTGQYMANLFDYVRELGNCSQFPDTTPFPPASGTTAAAASWLTLPVIITLSIGAVVIVTAIIIIVVLKCKNK